MSTSGTFKSPEKFAKQLQDLRKKRRETKIQLRDKVKRKSLNAAQKAQILSKTAKSCHICGGSIKGEWHADHVISHSTGGQHHTDNYLPAHPICNAYRKGYDSEEIQWILKLGVWLRTQIEKETTIGKLAAMAFCKNDQRRAGRRIQQKP